MRRSPKQPQEPSRIQKDLAGLFTRLGLGKQVEGFKILELWTKSLETINNTNVELLKAKTFALKLNKNMELVVGVRSASLANELQFLKPQLLENLNKFCQKQGYGKVKAIIFELR